MPNENAVLERELPAIIEAPAITPMQMLNMAVSQNADLDKLQKLMELQERWERNEAKKAYHRAFSAFKAEAVAVVKRIDISDGPLKGKKYADLAAAVDAATPFLSKHGLSASWKITKNEKDWLEACCTLTHDAGHSEEVFFGGPPDTGGAKNAMQARASTLSYLERYTFLAVTGLASKGTDDDARGGVKNTMAENVKADFLAAIEAVTETEALQQLWKQCAAACQQCGDIDAYETLKKAVNKRAKELR